MGINIQKIKNASGDKIVERKVSEFLDENFYSVLSASTYFRRTNELSDQCDGVDLYLNTGTVDEKVKNARSPNVIRDYFCSVEIYHLTKDGRYEKGWFVAPNIRTTHYFFIFNFEDESRHTNRVILVSFSKKELTDFLEEYIGIGRIIEDASKMQYAVKYRDDVFYTTNSGKKIAKLTKSYEDATVLAFPLTMLGRLSRSKVFDITADGQRKMTFNELRKAFN